MKYTSKITTRLTSALTVFAPLFFAFLLTACNFQKQPERISLEIPNGYAPARVARERTWEETATNAERLAFSGPVDTTPNVAPPAATAPTPLVALRPVPKLEKVASKSLKRVAFKKVNSKKRLASTAKYWKPVRSANKKVAIRNSYPKRLASNF